MFHGRLRMSPSATKIEEVILEAKRCRLDAVCFSEHRRKAGKSGASITVRVPVNTGAEDGELGDAEVEMEDWLVLATGLEATAQGPAHQGVGVALCPALAAAWRRSTAMDAEGSLQGGPRMLTVRLRVPVENGKMRNVSIISVYAPTYQTAQDEKDAF